MVSVKQSQILIRYGEIGLKAEHTRRQFTQQLKKNIIYACSKENIPIKIEIKRGRFFLHTAEIVKSSKVLQRIFGIVSFSPVWDSSSDLKILTTDVLELMNSRLNQESSFALRVRRSGNHEYTSQDAAIKIGKALCDHYQSSVDLNGPDVEFFIEIRDDKAYLFFEKIKGVGGLPYATQGKICCYVEKPEDILASWYLMKRGCRIQFFSVNSCLLEEIQNFLDRWYIQHPPIMTEKNEKQKMGHLKQESQKHDCQAICSGVNFLDKKKEILQEIKHYQTQFSLPILTPLISMNEQQIRNNAKKVGILL